MLGIGLSAVIYPCINRIDCPYYHAENGAMSANQQLTNTAPQWQQKSKIETGVETGVLCR